MELKRWNTWVSENSQELLIVPYGIETAILSVSQVSHQLLIVPYGIETSITTTKYTPKKNF